MDSIGPQDLLIQPFIQLINRLTNCLPFLVVTTFQSRTMTFELICLRAFVPRAEGAAGRGKKALGSWACTWNPAPSLLGA